MNVLGYMQDRGGVRNTPLILFQFLTVSLLVALGYSRYGLPGAVVAAGGILFVLFAAWRSETFPILFLLYIGLFETRVFSEQFAVIPFYFSEKTIPVFLIPAFIVLLLERSHAPARPDPGVGGGTEPVGVIVALFLTWALASAFIGLGIGHKPVTVGMELRLYSLFLAYFLWRSLFRWKQKIQWWMNVVAVVSVLVAIEYIILIVSVYTDIVTFVLFRNITRQSQMIIAGLPILLSIFLIYKQVWIRSGVILSVLLLMAQAFLSQQRIIWLTFALMLFIYATLFSFRKGLSLRTFGRWLSMVLITLGASAGVLFLAAWLFNTDISILLTRWEQVQSLTDPSFKMRVYDARNAIEMVGSHYLTGLGVGAELQAVPLGYYFFFFDVSYLVAFFKGGVPFAALLVLIYLGGIFRAAQVYFKAVGKVEQLLAMSIITALTGQLLSGVTTVSMIYYRFTFIWMLLVAAAVVLHENLKRQQVKELSGVGTP